MSITKRALRPHDRLHQLLLLLFSICGTVLGAPSKVDLRLNLELEEVSIDQ